ncbi:ABC transporter ATP-binding protein [Pusillimonas sp. T2]|uniref:ABC transporter ATP-binding protein n=1 Tax=Pusillimonas sp. T2 TaxID=1548123 RepID=UPI000B946800|nr:ABC transporter ATP-binding protein [Pusillimonas sp. T2]OXR49171.1 ABC transporter ATP-binding protein [Pusillimonas sp. T2]
MSEFLKVEGLTRRFGGVVAVRDVSFHMNEGEILGLMGANGAGKTTLFSMIAGNVAPSEGSIYFRGRGVPARPDEASQMGIARTFQIVRPFPQMSVLENCMVGALYGHRRLSDLQSAQDVCLSLLEEVGLAAQANKPASTLNLASRKRLEIARALATKPTLLLLDEVLAGLNATEVDAALELIRHVQERYSLSIIIIEHVMKVLMRMSDRIVVLHEGRKLMEGVPEAVGKDERVINAYLGEQHG